MDWCEPAVIVQLITAVILVIGLGLTWWQIRAMVKTSKASNYFDLVAYLQTDSIRDARDTVRNLKGKPFTTWTADEEKAAQNVASSFDIAAIAMKNKLINPTAFAIPWQTSIYRNYRILRKFIKARQKGNEDDRYFAHYVGLALYIKGKISHHQYNRIPSKF